MKIKKQIDLWSFAHFFGPLVITIICHCALIGILSAFMWEMFDHFYSLHPDPAYRWIFDKRGASWIDYLFGAVSSQLYFIYHLPRFWMLETCIFAFLFIAILYMFKSENW